MIIKVIGEGCKDCDKLYENVTEAVNELNLDAKVEKVEDLIEIVKLGVMTSPSVMVDGKLVVSGNVASVKNLVKILKKEIWQNICKINKTRERGCCKSPIIEKRRGNINNLVFFW